MFVILLGLAVVSAENTTKTDSTNTVSTPAKTKITNKITNSKNVINIKSKITATDKTVNSGSVSYKVNNKTVTDTNKKTVSTKVKNNESSYSYTLPSYQKSIKIYRQ